MSTVDFDVIIIGLGPSGGTLANLLAMNNLSILILEKEASIYNLPRAVHFDGQTQRIFQSMGIMDQIPYMVRKEMTHLVGDQETILLMEELVKILCLGEQEMTFI